MMYIRYPPSLRQVEGLLFERGIHICSETVRLWWNPFGPLFAAEIRRRRVQRRSYARWRWHLDEVLEGEVLEAFASRRRDRKSATRFLKRVMKCYGQPLSIVTDRLRSYSAALKSIGLACRQVCHRWRNNRAENAHPPFQRREGAMARFRDIKTLQKFAAVHAVVQNHFSHDRHLSPPSNFKENRSAALAEWRQLAA